ncbi:MAG: serine/threonine protein kinase, partial [Planctomycetes bacterium]|nr:serine/threonine protein kinase [Planctomycetota bacterium]
MSRHESMMPVLKTFLEGLDLIGRMSTSLKSAIGEISIDSDLDELGQTLGDFQILRRIGRGGMGIVYEANQISLNRRVAVKLLLHTNSFDPVIEKRFQREAQAAAKLHHPNIVPVFSVGCDRGVHF